MPATTALVRLAPPSFMAGYTFHFTTKQKLDESALKAQLTLAGYTHVSQVVSSSGRLVRLVLLEQVPGFPSGHAARGPRRFRPQLDRLFARSNEATPASNVP